MSIFGKVLAVLNILAAGAFVFLATQTRGTRHAWAYTAMRFERALDGFPVNKEEKDANGEPLADAIPDATVRAILPDGPVRTLEEEVARRKGELTGLGDAEKKQRLQKVLPLTARNGGEREEWLARVNSAKPEDLNNLIEEAFASAANPRLNSEVRRHAIAYLLIALAEEPADAQKMESNLRRVYNLVGVKAYTRAMDDHALNVRAMGARMREAIAQDQGNFVLEHDMLVRNLLTMADHIEDLRRHRQRLEEQKQESHVVLDARRKNDLKVLNAELATVDAELTKELSRQAGLEQKLFAFQRRLSQATERNLQLAQEIEKLELGR